MLLSVVFSVLLAQMAPGPAPTMVPNPAPDLSSISFMQGTWTCHSMLRGKDRPDTFTGSTIMNGRWIVLHDTAPPFDQYRSVPVHTDQYFTYDVQNKKWINVNVDDFGGYGFATSPGWQGNTMVWTDKSAQDGSVGVTTMKKVSDNQYTLDFTGTDGKGKPVPASSATCKKTTTSASF
jgi:hypothetical protein